MNIDRLLRLAVLLEDDARNSVGLQFNLNTWAKCGPDDVPTVACGTQACAVGLACLSGEFTNEGLLFKTSIGHDSTGPVVQITPRYKDWVDWDAVEEFFEIDDDASYELFVASEYRRDDLPTKGAEAEMAVANRIREFVARNT